MGIRTIKIEGPELISSIPGVSRSNSLVFSKLFETGLFEGATTHTLSQPIVPGYYYTYFNKNNSTTNPTVNIRNAAAATIDSFNLSTNVSQNLTYLNTTAASIEIPQAIAFSTITTGFSTSFTSIAYGDGLFVLSMTGTNTAITSGDLITWTARATTADGPLAYGNSGFIRGDLSRTGIGRSTNGITWTSQGISLTTSAHHVYFKNNFYIVFEQSSTRINYSTNTTTWTSTSLTRTSNPLRSVEHGNGVFAVGDSAGFVVRSTDLVTWTSGPRATATQINEIIFENGQFFIFATGVNGHRRTTDFLTYTTVAINFSTASGVNSASYSNGMFIATSTNNLGLVAFSTSGISWTEVANIGGLKNDSLIVDNTAIVVGNAATASQIELRNSTQLQIYRI